MASYEKDMQTKNRESLIARYHTNGVLMLGPGAEMVMSSKQLGDSYRTAWPGPDEFYWKGLHYRLLSHDAVLVEGAFFWKDSKMFPKGANSSYTGVLLKDRDQFKIRLELEFPEDLNAKIELPTLESK